MAYLFLCLLFSNRTHILNHITAEYLLVVGSPPHIEPPLPIRMNPLAKHPGGQLDRVAAHPLRATPLLQLGDLRLAELLLCAELLLQLGGLRLAELLLRPEALPQFLLPNSTQTVVVCNKGQIDGVVEDLQKYGMEIKLYGSYEETFLNFD